jgi:FAD/FMN-containing dehydrogenase
MGAGSLSIWVHNLKSFEFMPEYSVGQYSGMAVRVGAGVESWELFNHMAANNITVVAPGGGTVGSVGGWIAVAGHGSLTSKYGLGADQVLSINVVTADGRFRTVDPSHHQDLWWALRGGGPSKSNLFPERSALESLTTPSGTFGVITSVILKAYPPINITTEALSFSVNPSLANGTILPGLPPPRPDAPSTTDLSAFWRGVSLAYQHCIHVIAAGGYCFSYIHPLGPSSFAYSTSHIIPNITATAFTALLEPLYTQLNNTLSIPVTLPQPTSLVPSLYAGNGRRTGNGDVPINTRYRSRLFPASYWQQSPSQFDILFAAIRAGVEEGGYTFHGIAYSPTLEVAGWPGADSAVNPAWRRTALHGSLMEIQPEGISAAEARRRDEKAHAYVAKWKELTPGAGAYMNEGDPTETEWQESFYGAHYARLVEVKRRWDPWGVFWARTTVGSEAWEVITVDGYPAGQNGRLCRVLG